MIDQARTLMFDFRFKPVSEQKVVFDQLVADGLDIEVLQNLKIDIKHSPN